MQWRCVSFYPRYLMLLGIVCCLGAFLYIAGCWSNHGTYRLSRSYLKAEYSKSNIVEDILEVARLRVKLEMLNYNFTYSDVDKLDDLLTESGGTPIRSVVISTWRSGSSFLGQLLNAMPSTFYNYEPLLTYRARQVTRGLAPMAISTIRGMLKCDFPEDYIKFLKNISNRVKKIRHNGRTWELCQYKQELCFDANFTNALCKLFPFQAMKLVRMRLSIFKDLLEDKKILRFEDLVLNINVTTLRLLKFLRLQPSQSIEEFLLSHTNTSSDGPYTTFRVTKDVPYKWKEGMDFNHVLEIQEMCRTAMGLWGYELANNGSHLASKHFNPLMPYKYSIKHNQEIDSYSTNV